MLRFPRSLAWSALVVHVCTALALLMFPGVSDAQEVIRGEDDSWITFLSNRSGQNLLYRMRPDGSDAVAIFGGELRDIPTASEGTVLYREPHWSRQSPDGQLILSWTLEFGSTEYRFPSTRAMIYLLRPGTEWSRVVAPDGEEEFAWSPDSRHFAYVTRHSYEFSGPSGITRPRSSRVFVAGIDGSNRRMILDRPGVWFVEDWSPDGSRLLLSFQSTNSAYGGRRELLEFDLVGSERDGVSAKSPFLESYLNPVEADPAIRRLGSSRYSPDGTKIAAIESFPITRDNQFVPSRLVVIETGTGECRAVAEFEEGLRGPICWSPDGSEVLFSRYLPLDDMRERMPDGIRRERIELGQPGPAGLAIWAVRADGEKLRFLTTGWSPDWR